MNSFITTPLPQRRNQLSPVSVLPKKWKANLPVHIQIDLIRSCGFVGTNQYTMDRLAEGLYGSCPPSLYLLNLSPSSNISISLSPPIPLFSSLLVFHPRHPYLHSVCFFSISSVPPSILSTPLYSLQPSLYSLYPSLHSLYPSLHSLYPSLLPNLSPSLIM